jgi:hypothetical protein
MTLMRGCGLDSRPPERVDLEPDDDDALLNEFMVKNLTEACFTKFPMALIAVGGDNRLVEPAIGSQSASLATVSLEAPTL